MRWLVSDGNETRDDVNESERFGSGLNEWAHCSQWTRRVQGTLWVWREGHNSN